MQDTRLYQQILGLQDPWQVTKVELNVPEQQVDLWVEHDPQARFACPTCGKTCPLHDHAAERIWRHLDTCQFRTYLHARVPRVDCPEHGVANADVPWAAKGARFTLMMERLLIELLLACQNIESVCRLAKVGWDAVAKVMARAVARGQKRKKPAMVGQIGIDEKAYRRGHQYITIVSDLEHSAVEYVAEGRTCESIDGYYKQLRPEQLAAIEAVAMDMWQPYLQTTQAYLPADKIVLDRFHIMRHVNAALDRIRQSEHSELAKKSDPTLARSRQLWLWSQENLPEKHREQFARLRSLDLKTARAWAIKEHLRRLWDQPDVATARAFFGHWNAWVQRSKLGPLKRVAKTLKVRLEQIISYCRHPITSAGCEGLNSKIATMQARAAGYRNLERLKTAILFYCGKLDLYP